MEFVDFLMPKKLYSPEYWQERADKIRRLAEQISDPNAKQKMLSVAEGYEKLAKRAVIEQAISSAIENPEKSDQKPPNWPIR